ncbi:MAG: hypothetical protein JWM31_1621 [Solirubrobacterales bacterium]|nr:hypothetical protein [Solirubrobacterales bacterium]
MADSYISRTADAIRTAAGDDDGHDLLYLVYAVLALAKGEQVTASDVHDAWSAVAQYEGAAGGAVVPFAELPVALQERDEPFAEAVRAVSRALRVSNG